MLRLLTAALLILSLSACSDEPPPKFHMGGSISTGFGYAHGS